MAVIYGGTPYDTSEIENLRDDINAEDEAFEELRRKHNISLKNQCAEYTRLLSEQRPNYPTQSQIDAITTVAKYVHENTPYGDNLGYATKQDRDNGRELPSCILFDSAYKRLNVYAQAPYAPRSSASRMWKFTEEEVQDIRNLLTKLGLQIMSEWEHEDGVAFRIYKVMLQQ